MLGSGACSQLSGEPESALQSDVAACSVDAVAVSSQPFFPNLQFNIPTTFVRTPDNSTAVVTEKAGVIKAFPNRQDATPADVTTMIDFTSRVNSNAREPGVNGIAFHPQWPTVPEAYVTYDGFPTGQPTQWEWRLSRFISKDGGKTLDSDPANETILLRSVKIASEHNGGQLVFHPTEVGRTGVPLLYVSVGDSENAFGPAGNAQNLNTFFGKFLRIDILDEATRAASGQPFCPDSEKLCAETFTFPFNGETSVEVRGTFTNPAWKQGTTMTHQGSSWTATVPVPFNTAIQYKFIVNGSTWTLEPGAPTVSDGSGHTNNLLSPVTCTNFTCSGPLQQGTRIEFDAPADNPFAAKGTNPGAGLPIIYSWGHRNPWRWTFDQHDGTTDIWLGEVGQDAFDEVNIVTKGGNYGWNLFEANHTGFCGSGAQCDPTKLLGTCSAANSTCVGGHLTDPILELPHQANPSDPTTKNAGSYLLNSVTGGFVYRGTQQGMAPLVGHYIYADFESGNIFSFNPQKPTQAPINIGVTDQVTTWQVDNTDGALIAVGFHGRLSKLVPNGCPIPVDPNSRHYVFLSKQGIGTEFSAWNYYQAANSAAGTPHNDIPIIGTVQNPPPPPGFNPLLPDGGFTFLVTKPNYALADWQQQFMSASPQVSALYKNNLDLGFWRQMVCTQTIVAGQGGCSVTNWPATDAQGNPIEPTPAQLSDPTQTNLGTVAMNISPDGFVRFYVFQGAPPHDLQPFAILDNEGVKFAPQLCTPCHGGASSGNADLGSIFREFEPSALVKRAEISQAQAELEWFNLNQVVLGANSQLTGVATSSLTSGQSPAQVMTAYIPSMYPNGMPPGLPLSDPSKVPASYETDPAGSALLTAKQGLWSEAIGHYCIGCHRVNNIDLTNYAEVNTLSVSNGSRILLQQYFEPIADDPLRLRLVMMPQSSLQDTLFLADTPARNAVDDWLAALSSTPNTPMCAITFEIETDFNVPVFNPKTEALRIIGTTLPLPAGMPDPISNFNAAAPGLNLTREADAKHWLGTGVFPQGATISYQGCVGKNESVRFEFQFGQPNRTLAVPAQEALSVKFRWGTTPGTEVVQ
jgi:glucose/arabinose dehydrogenase